MSSLPEGKLNYNISTPTITGDNVLNASEVTPEYRRYGGQELTEQIQGEQEKLKNTLSWVANQMATLPITPGMLRNLDSFEQVFTGVMAIKLQLMIAKQKDYGPGNIQKSGLRGISTRATDKIERWKTLQGDPDAQVEKIKELLDDLADDASGSELDSFAYNVAKVVNPTNAVEGESLDDTIMDLGNYGDIAYIVLYDAWGKPLENV